jgi:hypothetical protein
MEFADEAEQERLPGGAHAQVGAHGGDRDEHALDLLEFAAGESRAAGARLGEQGAYVGDVAEWRGLVVGDRPVGGDPRELVAHENRGGRRAQGETSLAPGRRSGVVRHRGEQARELEGVEVGRTHSGRFPQTPPRLFEGLAPEPPGVAPPVAPPAPSAESLQVPTRHAWSPIQTAPPSKNSFFQIGTSSFSRSIVKRAASKASARCAEDTAIATLAWPTGTTPVRCTTATRAIDQRSRASPAIRSISLSAMPG